MSDSATEFTQIVFLVVIAIIAILAGMLLPALNNARERGKAASCMSNLKQMAHANAQYITEFNYPIPIGTSGDKGLFSCPAFELFRDKRCLFPHNLKT